MWSTTWKFKSGYHEIATDDTAYIYAICKKIDPEAFMNTISTSRVIGRFYLRPRD